jgi:hypothetical protein
MRPPTTARFHQMHPSSSGHVFRAREEGPCNQKARPDETVRGGRNVKHPSRDHAAYQPSAADAVRGSPGDRIAVDQHADAGCVLTVCLRANHTSRAATAAASGFARNRRLALERAKRVRRRSSATVTLDCATYCAQFSVSMRIAGLLNWNEALAASRDARTKRKWLTLRKRYFCTPSAISICAVQLRLSF